MLLPTFENHRHCASHSACHPTRYPAQDHKDPSGELPMLALWPARSIGATRRTAFDSDDWCCAEERTQWELEGCVYL